MEGIDYTLSAIMTDYWTNFAKYGDPNGKGLPHWNKFTEENHAIMEINENHTKSIDTDDKVLISMDELLYNEVISDKSK